jgi:hypothetical protein
MLQVGATGIEEEEEEYNDLSNHSIFLLLFHASE